MGILNNLFGKKKDESSGVNGGSIKIAFVLLSEAVLPDAESVVQAFSEFAGAGEKLKVNTSETSEEAKGKVLSFDLGAGEMAFVALMPAAVPNGEAEFYVQHSLSSFKDGWELPQHTAHLLVTYHPKGNAKPIVDVSLFTSLVAAVTKVSPSVGVYWKDAGATHEADFFTGIASENGIVPRMMLWSGISIAREKDGRMSILSTGMEQLSLPDMLLVTSETSGSDVIETVYDLLSYVAERGEPIPDGDTIGRSNDERLSVCYVKSPIDAKKKVWRVELS